MTQEEKQLLLVDLCSRLTYGVKALIPECRQDAATLIGADDRCFTVKYGESTIYCPFHISIKPYLRPLSSMTEEEVKEFAAFASQSQHRFFIGDSYYWYNNYEEEDWLNKHHFDYRGLIEKGLAISTEEFNPYEKV